MHDGPCSRQSGGRAKRVGNTLMVRALWLMKVGQGAVVDVLPHRATGVGVGDVPATNTWSSSRRTNHRHKAVRARAREDQAPQKKVCRDATNRIVWGEVTGVRGPENDRCAPGGCPERKGPKGKDPARRSNLADPSRGQPKGYGSRHTIDWRLGVV